MKLSLLLAFYFFLGSGGQDPLKARITKVIDGNTLEFIDKENETYIVLISGIDAPELGQDYGNESREFLMEKVLNKNVNIEILGKNRKGVRLAKISMGRKDLANEMIVNGWAWKDRSEDDALMLQAREKQLGIWKNSDPVPPWIYVRQNSMKRPKSL